MGCGNSSSIRVNEEELPSDRIKENESSKIYRDYPQGKAQLIKRVGK